MKLFKNSLLAGMFAFAVFGNAVLDAEANVELVKENLSQLKDDAGKTLGDLKKMIESKVSAADKSKILTNAHKALKDLQKKHARLQSDIRTLTIKCVKTEGKGVVCADHTFLENLDKTVREKVSNLEQFFSQIAQEHVDAAKAKYAPVQQPSVKK